MIFLFPPVNPVSEAQQLRKARWTSKEYSENQSFQKFNDSSDMETGICNRTMNKISFIRIKQGLSCQNSKGSGKATKSVLSVCP